MDKKSFSSYPDVVTIEELCYMLRIGKNSVYNLLKTKAIKHFCIGKKYFIPKAYVIEYIVSKSNNLYK